MKFKNKIYQGGIENFISKFSLDEGVLSILILHSWILFFMFIVFLFPQNFPKYSQTLCKPLMQPPFSDSFKLTLGNLFLLVVIGDLNAKSNCYSSDKTTYEGNKIETITSHFNLHQLIKEPTNIFENSSSYFDLSFTSQPNLVLNSVVHLLFTLSPSNCICNAWFTNTLSPTIRTWSLALVHLLFTLSPSNCICKVWFIIHYHPPYERDVWHD